MSWGRRRVVMVDAGGCSIPRLYELLVALGLRVSAIGGGFSPGEAEAALEGADGLVIGGRMRASSAADRLAAAAFRAARKAGIPRLGVCYGAQIINELMGGSLELMPSRLRGLNPVRLGEDPAFSEVPALPEGPRVYEARARRIRRLAPGLEPIAWSEAGGIEAYRGEGVYGFLFHPELSGGVGVLIMRGALRALGLS